MATRETVNFTISSFINLSSLYILNEMAGNKRLEYKYVAKDSRYTTYYHIKYEPIFTILKPLWQTLSLMADW